MQARELRKTPPGGLAHCVAISGTDHQL